MQAVDVLNDEFYMKLALELARGAQGQTAVNPVVGCVIVKDGRIVGTGAHLKMGTAHAEIHALQMAGAEAEGATVYVTLEPCSHFGRTPPCSDRLAAERVSRVVVAAADPNPKVAGRGIARLREAGIAVDTGCLEQEARGLNEAFNKYIVTGMPFVTLKTASTLDGKIASKTGHSKWITGSASREYVHTLRHRHQAILVGVDTVIADDPQLNTRLTVPALDPIPIVADSTLRLPPTARLLAKPGTIVLTTERADKDRAKRLEAAGAVLIRAGAGPRVDLADALRQLGKREIGSILLEGGGRLNGAMLEKRLVDKMVLFIAPKLIGGAAAPGNFQFSGFERMDQAIELERTQVKLIGPDICLTGYPRYEGGDTDCLPES